MTVAQAPSNQCPPGCCHPTDRATRAGFRQPPLGLPPSHQARADAARAQNLAGFPPILIQVGSAETLLADATRLAAAAGAADVDVTLQVWPHMIHAWPVWNARLADGRRALASAGQFTRTHLR